MPSSMFKVLPLPMPIVPASGPGPAGTPAPNGPPDASKLVDELFTRVDVDKNGKLTVDELLDAIDPKDAHPGLSATVSALVGLVDTDKDPSTLSRADVLAAVARFDPQGGGKGPMADAAMKLWGLLVHAPDPKGPPADPPKPPVDKPEPPTLDDFVTGLLTRFDGDKSGGIDLDELLKVLDPAKSHPGFDKMLERTLNQVDTNDDHSMSAAELKAAIGRLDDDQPGVPGHPPGHVKDATVHLIGVMLDPDGMPGHEG